MYRELALRRISSALVAIVAVLATMFAFAGVAAAADVSVSVWGAQTVFAESDLEDGTAELNLANISGVEGTTVFLTVSSGDSVLAKNMPYTLGEDGQQGSNIAGMFSIDAPSNLEELLANGTCKAEVYSDRASSDQLFSGVAYGVWANLDDGGELLIGARVTSGGAFTFTPPQTVYKGSQAYRLASTQPKMDGNLAYYDYEAFDAKGAVEGTISYVDTDGNVIKTETITIPENDSVTYSIPSAVTNDGEVYRTLAYTETIEVTNPGKTSFVISCIALAEEDSAAAGHYLANIQMVDESGSVLANDSVSVTGTFTYEAPTVIYKQKDVDGKTRAVAYDIVSETPCVLSAENDQDLVVNGQRTVVIKYKSRSLEGAEVEVSFLQLDGRSDEDVAGRLLGTQTETVSTSSTTAQPASEITYDGTTYKLVGDPASYAYTYGSGKIQVVDVYYVPEGYDLTGSYEVAVKYVDIADGSVIAEETHEVAASDGSIEIASPESFNSNGVEYIRLDGQEDAIVHNFCSAKRTYTVYYRDVNNDAASTTVITRTRVIVKHVGVDGGQDASAANTAYLNMRSTYTVADGDGNKTISNEEGLDSNSERSADAEAVKPVTGDLPVWLIPAAVGFLVVVALIAALTTRRKRNDA